jgi:hypothetical protein
MAQCETCGNNYDKTFEIVLGGQNHTFDSFECAIHKLAPTCAHCSCRILGHGVEAGGQSIAALIVPKNRECTRSEIALIERLLRYPCLNQSVRAEQGFAARRIAALGGT